MRSPLDRTWLITHVIAVALIAACDKGDASDPADVRPSDVEAVDTSVAPDAEPSGDVADPDDAVTPADAQPAADTSAPLPDASGPDSGPADAGDLCADRELCPEQGARACAVDGAGVETCEADADGCLVWSPLAQCPTSEVCVAAGDTVACVARCSHLPASRVCSEAGALRCDGDRLETCAADQEGCLAFRDPLDCASVEGANTCGETGETAACVFDVCKGAAGCVPGAAECNGEQLTTCALDAFGCADLATVDCGATDATCDADRGRCLSAGDPCAAVPVDLRCDPSEALGCDPSTPSVLRRCIVNDFGCPVVTLTDCAAAAPDGAAGYCDGASSDARCRVDLADRCAGKDLCDPAEADVTRCDDSGAALLRCGWDAVGCLVRQEFSCAEGAPWDVCLEPEAGQAFCGRACEDACDEGERRCFGDLIAVCAVNDRGCLDFAADTDCATTGWSCGEAEGEVACVLPPPVGEIEPNDTCESATILNASGLATGELSLGDADWYTITLTEPLDLRIETLDADFTGCPGDTSLTLYAPDCETVLADDDDDGVGNCSRIDPRADSLAALVPPGTYHIRVSAFDAAPIASYGLQVTAALPVCGNGLLEREEACDDGNVTEGDGCDAACDVAPGWSCNGAPSFCVDTSVGDTCGESFDLDGMLAGRKSAVFGPFDNTPYEDDLRGFNGNTCPVNGGAGTVLAGGGGRDLVFGVTVQPGEILTASMADNNFDEYIALVTDCATVSPSTCLYADDAPGALVWTNAGTTPRRVFIVADAWGATSTGLFNLQVSLRSPACGDGLIEGAEQCDGGAGGIEGCSAQCSVLPGYVCAGAPSRCIREGAGNTCATADLITAGTTVGTTAGASGYGDAYGAYGGLCATGSTPGHDRVYAVEVPPNHQLAVTYTPSGFDGVLALTTSCAELPASCVMRRDATNAGGSETGGYANTSTAPQLVFVVADAVVGGGDFALQVSLTPLADLTRESEPNNGCVDADPLPLERSVVASVDPGSESDFFTFTLDEPRQVRIQTAGTGGVGTPCPGDTRLELFQTSCAAPSVATDDDSGRDECSLIQRSLPAGTYWLRTRSWGAVVSNYSVTLTTSPAP
jgi:cysteine-rich repeat protein